MKQIFVCHKCKTVLAELSNDLLRSYGFGLKIVPNAYAEDLAWAVCEKCHAETPIDASFLKHILKGRKPPA
jgi:ribosomal protein L40E